MPLTGPAGDGTADRDADSRLLAAARAALSALGAPGVLGLAVSGGSDSMALLHLFAAAAPAAGWRLAVATVDHRLRPEAAAEAALVARACAALGLPHDTLAWQDHPATGNLMAAAAAARYRLLADWAAGRGIGHVALAHTADDQAETLLMGLARQSGLEGLSGMRPRWESGGVTFLRPLLGQTRAALRGHLVRRGVAWAEDPTNDDPRFQRTRARRALRALKPLGITAERLAGTAGHLGEALAALRAATGAALAEVGREAAGAVALRREGLARLHPELARGLLLGALRWLSGSVHPPRTAGVERLALAIAQGRAATLGGCRAGPGTDCVWMSREPRAVVALSTPTDAPWDGRWRLTGPHAPDLAVRALGATGLRRCPAWRGTGLPREVLTVTPAVWRGDTLVAAPAAGWPQGWTASVSPSLAATFRTD